MLSDSHFISPPCRSVSQRVSFMWGTAQKRLLFGIDHPPVPEAAGQPSNLLYLWSDRVLAHVTSFEREVFKMSMKNDTITVDRTCSGTAVNRRKQGSIISK